MLHRSRRDVLAAAVGSVLSMSSAHDPQRRTATQAPVRGYRVRHVFPHDREAFTQGLFFSDGALYEGTGLVGRSSIRKVRVETGEVLRIRRTEPRYFGEGVTAWRDTLVQLTWQSEVGFVYDRATFQPLRRFTYAGEGWGLTHDDTHLIMSDGSPYLRFLDPGSFKPARRVLVQDGGRPVENLNELEYVHGEILANVWQSERIVRVSPATGRVNGWIDLHGLLDPRDSAGVDVLNGIAYDAARDRLFVTGKLWPKLFEIRIQ